MSAYIGRFAPSPSGPLHIGSLISALASFLDARHYQGQWLVRMEDIDPPREEAGAKDVILNSLIAHGLQWDGPVRYQSQCLSSYQDALTQLQAHIYRCQCARNRLLGLRGVYDGHCRERSISHDTPHSIRVRLDQLTEHDLVNAEHYHDLFQGEQQQQLEREVGDFILQRKDGLVAYQLAVVLDDIDQGVTHIIRGSDLLCSTPRQRYLQLLLGQTAEQLPTYGHIPVATNSLGQKLSKQHKAKGIDNTQAFANLCYALEFLQHPPPNTISSSQDIDQLLAWAVDHWQRSRIPQVLAFVVDENGQKLV